MRKFSLSIPAVLVFTLAVIGSASAAASAAAEAGKGNRFITQAGYAEALVNYLSHYLGRDTSGIAVSDLSISGDKAIPEGETRFQFVPKNRRRMTGDARFEAVIYVDGAAKNKVQLSAQVDVFDLTVCAGRNLRKGEVIDVDDLYLGRRKTGTGNKGVLTDMDMAVGYTVKQHVKADTSLKEWMLEKTPVVNRGDKVTVIAETDVLQVTVPGLILEKGGIGDMVKVENIMSKKKIYAKVMDSTTVVVDF